MLMILDSVLDEQRGDQSMVFSEGFDTQRYHSRRTTTAKLAHPHGILA